MKKESEKVGHYVCALVDILGQKVELNKLDDIESIRNQHDEVLKICRNAYGKVKILRKAISESGTYFNSFAKRCEKSPRIKNTFFSDLIVMHLSLSKGGEAHQIKGTDLI